MTDLERGEYMKELESDMFEKSIIQQSEEWRSLFKEDPKLAIDCQIHRALKSGEMHNWIVCCNTIKKTSEELSAYWGEIKEDIEYMGRIVDTNERYVRFLSDSKQYRLDLVRENIRNGTTEYSALQLVLFGFGVDFAKEHGVSKNAKI